MATPQEQYHTIEAQVDRMLLPGWTKQWVDPPWAGAPPACRGCGADPFVLKAAGKKSSMAPMTFADRKKKIMWWSIVHLCETCVNQKPARNKIAVELFAPLLPPDVGPEDLS